MPRNWFLRYSLLILVATRGTLAYNHEAGSSFTATVLVLKSELPADNLIIHDVAENKGTGKSFGLEKLWDRAADPASPAEKEIPVLQTPKPTTIPLLRERQDDGQIQALSSQLRSLSQSATQAISSVSSSLSSSLSQISQSAQSVRQSADQAVRSASQEADQANRQLSQTQSSASSAVSAANSRASDQLSRSMSSMSSQLDSSLASARSSASDAVSSARAAASEFAASQIQAFKADASGATGVRGPTNPSVQPSQSSSAPPPNLVVIVVASILGTAVLSTASSCLFLRYRTRNKRHREVDAPANNKDVYEKPIAVRGSLNPRFPRFGGDSTSSTQSFKLTSSSHTVPFEEGQQEARKTVTFADSGKIDSDENGSTRRLVNDTNDLASSTDELQPFPFRLQKSNGISSATTVRLIRVGSEKGKSRPPTDLQQTALESMGPPAAMGVPKMSQKRYTFRDSSDMESNEPTPTAIRATRPPNVRSQSNSDGGSLNRAVSLRQPRQMGGNFAAFPRARNESARESMMSRRGFVLNGAANAPGKGDENGSYMEPTVVDNGHNSVIMRSSRDMFSNRF